MQRHTFAKTTLAACCIFALAGCGTQKINVINQAEASKFNPATSARLRLVSGEGALGGFVSGQKCETYFNETTFLFPQGRSGWVNAHIKTNSEPPLREPDTQNSVIGMPETAATTSINSSKRYYDEYVVPANQPVITGASMDGSKGTCTPTPVLFTPEPGADYEISYQFVQNGLFSTGCQTHVRKLSKTGSIATEAPVFPKFCAKNDKGRYVTVDLLEVIERAKQGKPLLPE